MLPANVIQKLSEEISQFRYAYVEKGLQSVSWFEKAKNCESIFHCTNMLQILLVYRTKSNIDASVETD